MSFWEALFSVATLDFPVMFVFGESSLFHVIMIELLTLEHVTRKRSLKSLSFLFEI